MIDLSDADADVKVNADPLAVPNASEDRPITDQQQPSLPLAPPTEQNRQLRCRPTKSSLCNIDHVPVVKPKMKLVDPLRLSSYGLGHTDGGSAKVKRFRS